MHSDSDICVNPECRQCGGDPDYRDTGTPDYHSDGNVLRRAIIFRLDGYKLRGTDLAQLTDEELAQLLAVTK